MSPVADSRGEAEELQCGVPLPNCLLTAIWLKLGESADFALASESMHQHHGLIVALQDDAGPSQYCKPRTACCK